MILSSAILGATNAAPGWGWFSLYWVIRDMPVNNRQANLQQITLQSTQVGQYMPNKSAKRA